MNVQKQRGITLMELLVVVVVIGILTAIAYPSYRKQAIRANRTEAKTLLMQVSQSLEKCYTRMRSYADCIDGPVNVPGASTDMYALTVDNSATDATHYLIEATPQGGQAEDERCGVLSLDETGRRDQSGAGDEKECW